MTYTAHYSSPVGQLTLASDGSSLTGLWMDGQSYFGAALECETVFRHDLDIFTRTQKWLDRYFAGERPAVSELPLSPAGSPFRQTVWRLLVKIPYGQTAAYKSIAKEAAVQLERASMSCQAVGGAAAHNPICIIIPCHRLVGSNGSLTGYAGGIDRKRWLLAHEGVEISRFSQA